MKEDDKQEEKKQSLLPEKQTPVQVELLLEKLWIYGDYGIGKTTFSSHFDNPLFICTEPGHGKIECFQAPVKGWVEFKNICAELRDTKHKFKTLIIDTVDNLHIMCSRYVNAKHGVEHEGDLGHGKGWYFVRREFESTLMALSTLNMGVIFISHSKSELLSSPSGEYNRYAPSMGGKIADVVGGYVDHIFYFCMKEDGEKVGSESRTIHVKPSRYWISKSRGDVFIEDMPMDYGTFKKEYEEGIKRLKGAKK